MRNKTLIFIVFLALLISCKSKMQDPTMNFKIGEDENVWKNKLKSALDEGIISSDNKNSGNYKFYFIRQKDSIESNFQLNTDGYDFGKLRTLEFTTVINTPSIKVDSTAFKLLNWLIEYYGPPTDTIKRAWFEDRIIDKRFKYNYNIEPPSGSLCWTMSDYTIVYYISENTWSRDEGKYFLANGTLIYKINSLLNDLTKIYEEVRNNLTAKDIIKVELESPSWVNVSNRGISSNNFDFRVDLFLIERISKEESRTINSVKFDIVLTDEFKEELCRIKDVVYEPYGGLTYGTAILRSGNYFSVIYSSLWTDTQSRNLEKARRIQENRRLKVYADVTAVVFEDGQVLR